MSEERRLPSLPARLALVAGLAVLGLGWWWTLGSACWLQGAGETLRAALVLVVLAGPLLALRRLGPRRTVAVMVAAGLAWAIAFHLIAGPRTDRDWVPEQARTVRVELEEGGRFAVVDGVRDFRHAAAGVERESWERRRYDLQALDSLDFLIEPLPALPGLAHVMLSFGFSDGERLLVSAEVRREKGERYSPVAGLFRRYELVYVLADERDALALRLNGRGHELRIHPLRAEPAALREMLLAILRRAELLGERPELYGTLRNNCTTNLVRHFEDLRGRELPLDWRLVLPLHADAVAWELGLVDAEGSLEQARERHAVRGPVDDSLPGAAFSASLRRGR